LAALSPRDAAPRAAPAGDSQLKRARGEPGEGSILGGRYRLIHALGAGGMATVFLAEDEVLGREVAVKLLRTESPGGAARRFAREARLGAALNHPNIVAVYDIVTESDQLVIVMEYVRGPNLSAALRDGPLEEEEALRVLWAVAAALDHAHERGIVHRDVKPSNVLIRVDGVVKLADLGVAKALEDTGTTEAGQVPGTPLYMAPELLAGKRVTPAADVCSLALVAYEVLSGRRPRSGRTVPEVAERAATEPPPDLREARPHTPPAAAELLARAMDRDPARRPGTAGELVEGLGAALAGGQTRGAEAPAAVAATEPAAVSREPRPPTERIAAPPVATPTPREPELEQPATAPTPPPPEPAPRERSRRPRWAAPALLAIVLALVLVMAALFANGDSEEGTSSPESPSGGSASAESQSPEPKTAAAAERAVQGFYERAAAGDYEGAEALATSELIRQIDGFDQFDTLNSIHFEQLDGSVSADTAEVSISTVAAHTDRVDNCSGSVGLVFEDKWLLDGLAIECG
jgi:eukaryotic-like serine/threonine-protein kinase